MVALVVVVVGALVAAHTVPFPFLLEAFRPSQALWRVETTPGMPPTLYLTFDDGPNAAWTPPLLDALRDTGSRGTFFLIDDHITAETAPIVRRIADEGHAIALHSGTRRLMILSPDDLASHLKAAADRIHAITGREPCRLFRPHAGWRSMAMYRGLSQAGYRLAGWSWGMWDFDWWRTPRADRLVRRLANKASAGDIIVIHDGHHRNPRADRRHAAETVMRLVPTLRARGFEFAPLCDRRGLDVETPIRDREPPASRGEFARLDLHVRERRVSGGRIRRLRRRDTWNLNETTEVVARPREGR